MNMPQAILIQMSGYQVDGRLGYRTKYLCTAAVLPVLVVYNSFSLSIERYFGSGSCASDAKNLKVSISLILWKRGVWSGSLTWQL